MKTTTRPGIATLILATTIAALLSAPSARAVVGQWTGGSTGTWDISSANWSGGSNPAWDLANGPLNTAVFATAGDAAAISGGVYLNQLTFNTAATVTGPAQAPRPASSTPATRKWPRRQCSRS